MNIKPKKLIKMDNGEGLFKAISEKKYDEQMKELRPMVFKEGEIIEVRGSRLRVHKISGNKITFKLLPQLSKKDG